MNGQTSRQEWFEETLHDDLRETLRISRVVLQRKTAHQEMMIFENDLLGRVLTLDGVVQTTEGDEYIYHEMLAHVPLFAHGQARDILIIGGGDGGCLREILKHPVRRAVLVDIDRAVIDLCKEHMPSLSRGAFEDSRTHVVIEDGRRFLGRCGETFDVIIVDSTDPIGPGKALFSKEFYAACRDRLNRNGILVTQNGVPFVQTAEFIAGHRARTGLFSDTGYYLATIPTYNGGPMAFGWASDDPAARRKSEDEITVRIPSGFAGRYYNPAVHTAAFALPNDISALMDQAGSTPTA